MLDRAGPVVVQAGIETLVEALVDLAGKENQQEDLAEVALVGLDNRQEDLVQIVDGLDLAATTPKLPLDGGEAWRN